MKQYHQTLFCDQRKLHVLHCYIGDQTQTNLDALYEVYQNVYGEKIRPHPILVFVKTLC